jgi:hypothetical protein
VLLVDMTRCQTEILEPLGLNQKEIEKVMGSKRYKSEDEKMLKVRYGEIVNQQNIPVIN